MNTQTRLIALLCLLLAVFGVSLAFLRAAQREEASRMLANVQAERSALLDSLLELSGESLKNFAHDYSYWDEMLEFAQQAQPDANWARVNIDASLNTFHANAAWVLKRDGTPVYATAREIDPAPGPLPVPVAKLLPKLEAQKFVHFFARSATGLLELRGAPLQPSADTERRSEPQGWLLVARQWNHSHLDNFARVMNAEVDLAFAPHVHGEPSGVHLLRHFSDLDGNPVAYLHAHYRPVPLELLQRDNENDIYLFTGIAVSVLLVTTFGLSRWVITPLRRLEQSLQAQSATPLRDMARERDEFGRLAQLAEAAFEQRRHLESEIEERRRIEGALRRSQEELRQSVDLKTRLARDLHDGVIQSIYAAGLGLEGLRSTLHSDPAAAERRLNAAQASLNHTIREVRSFIQGLEPEQTDRPDFTQSLRSLVGTLQSLHPIDLRLEVAVAPQRLTVREEVHALQIVRECVSNAIRHGEARRIDISLRETPHGPELRIVDNGSGFDPTEVRQRGSGLANLASRAAEIGAKLELTSAAGKGTGVIVQFAQR